jgi:hypothetical protein
VEWPDVTDVRHDGCGGRAGKVELMTGIEGVTNRPVRRIVLMELRHAARSMR